MSSATPQSTRDPGTLFCPQPYFCTVRTKSEIRRDREDIFLSIATLLFNASKAPSISIFRYTDNREKFKEWVEDVKLLAIYKQPFITIKTNQIVKTIGELLSLNNADLYVFNECCFLLPEVGDDRAIVTEIFGRILDRFPTKNKNIYLSQRQFLKHLALDYYAQWATEDYQKSARLDRFLIDFQLLIFPRLPSETPTALTKHPNPDDPDRYRKLTIEVEPFALPNLEGQQSSLPADERID